LIASSKGLAILWRFRTRPVRVRVLSSFGMSSGVLPRLSPEEYLDLDRAADQRSEYWNGEMFALSGGSVAHATIVTNLVVSLAGGLRGGTCRVFSTDLRLRVSATGLYTYPDVLVICGQIAFADDRNDTVLNPKLLVEVLSPSTQDYDRGRKFAHYRALPSLEEYVVVAQDRPHVEQFVREDLNRWTLTDTDGLDALLFFRSIGCSAALREVFDGVELPPS